MRARNKNPSAPGTSPARRSIDAHRPQIMIVIPLDVCRHMLQIIQRVRFEQRTPFYAKEPADFCLAEAQGDSRLDHPASSFGSYPSYTGIYFLLLLLMEFQMYYSIKFNPNYNLVQLLLWLHHTHEFTSQRLTHSRVRIDSEAESPLVNHPQRLHLAFTVHHLDNNRASNSNGKCFIQSVAMLGRVMVELYEIDRPVYRPGRRGAKRGDSSQTVMQ